MIPHFLGYVGIAIFLACWLGGVITWFLSAKYMLKTMASYHPDKKWGKYLPYSILIPSFFTDDGNRYRAKLLRHLIQFLVFTGTGLSIGLGLKAFTPS